MVKKFEPTENGYVITFDRPTLELLGINPETPFELTTERGGVFLSPVRELEDHKSRVGQSAARMAAIHRASLRTLAQ